MCDIQFEHFAAGAFLLEHDTAVYVGNGYTAYATRYRSAKEKPVAYRIGVDGYGQGRIFRSARRLRIHKFVDRF